MTEVGVEVSGSDGIHSQRAKDSRVGLGDLGAGSLLCSADTHSGVALVQVLRGVFVI